SCRGLPVRTPLKGVINSKYNYWKLTTWQTVHLRNSLFFFAQPCEPCPPPLSSQPSDLLMVRPAPPPRRRKATGTISRELIAVHAVSTRPIASSRCPTLRYRSAALSLNINLPQYTQAFVPSDPARR